MQVNAYIKKEIVFFERFYGEDSLIVRFDLELQVLDASANKLWHYNNKGVCMRAHISIAVCFVSALHRNGYIDSILCYI